MINKKKKQAAMDKIVSLKRQLKSKELEVKTAYFEYYKLTGLTTEQAERML